MGNRALITSAPYREDNVGIYVHWNGGRSSIEGFLDVAAELGVRDGDYGIARLTQIIGNFFGGTLSLGVGLNRDLRGAATDNGVYVVDLENWKIVDRLDHRGHRTIKPSGEEIDGEKRIAVCKEALEKMRAVEGKVDA